MVEVTTQMVISSNPTKERKYPIQVMMTPSMRLKIDTLAKSQGRSFSYYVVQILENYLTGNDVTSDVA